MEEFFTKFNKIAEDMEGIKKMQTDVEFIKKNCQWIEEPDRRP